MNQQSYDLQLNSQVTMTLTVYKHVVTKKLNLW